MALLTLTPADGWVDLGAVESLIVCQVDPRVISVRTPALEVLRGDAPPAHDRSGVVQLGGWSISGANIDALGLGARLYARALAPSVRVIVEVA
jgi:hypothetical protein